MAGTSMATPLVTGIVALLLEQNPRMTPADVKAALIAKSSPEWDAKRGHGLIKL